MLHETTVRDESSFFVVSAGQSRDCDAPHKRLRAQFLDKPENSAIPARQFKLAALAVLGLSVGVGGAVLGVSFVQASDRIDMYETFRSDARVRREAASRPQAYTSASSYAPARGTVFQPLGTVTPQNRVAFPEFNLNPFNPTGSDHALRSRNDQRRKHAKAPAGPSGAAIDTVSGAADVPRSICVRLCDGYQHPLGNLHNASDLPGHEALCRAMFPDVPTRVLRVAAGATTIDDAVGSDGKTYRSLPMAYAYQTSIDPACARPRNGSKTVSVLKDFTLRAGDTVVMNGKPRVFNGGTNYPFTSANFRDFRSSSAVSDNTRKQIDQIVGVSHQERLRREVQRLSQVREANAQSGNRASDVINAGVRIEDSNGQPIMRSTPPRVIEIYRR